MISTYMDKTPLEVLNCKSKIIENREVDLQYISSLTSRPRAVASSLRLEEGRGWATKNLLDFYLVHNFTRSEINFLTTN
jgi:hypothetical protein